MWYSLIALFALSALANVVLAEMVLYERKQCDLWRSSAEHLQGMLRAAVETQGASLEPLRRLLTRTRRNG